MGKKNADYVICTEQENPSSNTSALSYGHCRLATPDSIGKIIEKSVLHLGADEEKLRFVYSQSGMILDLFGELGIDFEYRSFGIIPSSERRGGRVILERIQKHIPVFMTGMEVISISQIKHEFEIEAKTPEGMSRIRAKYVVLATGGYGGTFEHTDNCRYKNYNIFDMVRQLGGEIINMDSIFVHPFGYCGGRKILIGNETRNGEFVDENGGFVFDERVRKLVKNNDYHEIFPEVLAQTDACRLRGRAVCFVSSDGKKTKIVPSVHYTGGGIKTDYLGRVVGNDGLIENLFAIGECQADGSKNGGRLPGYPFTAAIVYGKVLAELLP